MKVMVEMMTTARLNRAATCAARPVSGYSVMFQQKLRSRPSQ